VSGFRKVKLFFLPPIPIPRNEYPKREKDYCVKLVLFAPACFCDDKREEEGG
jgi:hypothetical protein